MRRRPDGAADVAADLGAGEARRDRDPLTCAVEELPATRVLRTELGGKTIWDAGAL
jgi:hypothetical protein